MLTEKIEIEPYVFNVQIHSTFTAVLHEYSQTRYSFHIDVRSKETNQWKADIQGDGFETKIDALIAAFQKIKSEFQGAFSTAEVGKKLLALLYQLQRVSFAIPKALMPKTSNSIRLSPAEIAEIRKMVSP